MAPITYLCVSTLLNGNGTYALPLASTPRTAGASPSDGGQHIPTNGEHSLPPPVPAAFTFDFAAATGANAAATCADKALCKLNI